MSAPTGSGRRIAVWRTIGLVAWREFSTRVTQKVFLVTTAVLLVGIVAGGFLLSTVGTAATRPQPVGVTEDSAALEPALEAAATATGVTVDVQVVGDDGEDLVRDGTLTALVGVSEGELVVVVAESVPILLEPAFTAVAQQLALSQEIAALGGDPAEVTTAIATARPQVTTLESTASIDEAQAFAGLLSGVLIFVAIVMAGQLVAQGVVEEKTSRVVELLLATIRPWQLMAGKVIGVGLVGLLQLGLILGAGVFTASRTGAVAGSGLDLGAIAGWVVVWFLIGYVMYSLVLAALAALVSRQEDVQAVIAPVVMVAMVPYIIGVSVATTDPSSPLVVWLSRVPFFAPFLMPIRITLGTVPGWELALSLLVALAFIPLLVWFAGVVYRNAVLRTGARVPLREALRGH